MHHVNYWSRTNAPTNIIRYEQVGSIGSSLHIYGELSGDCILNVVASVLHATNKSPIVKINAIEANLTTAQFLKDLIGGNISDPINSCKSDCSFGSDLLLPPIEGKDIAISGAFAAPKILAITGKNSQLTIGSSNVYYLDPVDPIRDLGNKPYSLQLTFMHEDLKNIVNRLHAPQFNFLLRENFWFNERSSQSFYEDLIEHIFILAPGGKFKKLVAHNVLKLTPHLLLKAVRDECQEVLRRGYIYEDQILDLEFVKQMHINAGEYFKRFNLNDENLDESVNNALILSGSSFKVDLPNKPIIYYKCLMDQQSQLEILLPLICIPREIINKVRGDRTDVINTGSLLILSEDLSCTELLGMNEHNSVLKTILLEHINKDPNFIDGLKAASARKMIDVEVTPADRMDATNPIDDSIEIKPIEESIIRYNEEGSHKNTSSSVKFLGGAYNVGKLGVLTPGKIEFTGELSAEDAFLGSLFNDFVATSTKKRNYNGENFQDRILQQAKIHVNNIVHCYAGGDVLLAGVDTKSKVKTEILALGNILDLPVELIEKQVEHFYGRRSYTRIANTAVKQHTSSHSSEGEINFESLGSSKLQAPNITAGKFRVIAGGEALLEDVSESSFKDYYNISSKRTLGFKRTKEHRSASTMIRSKGAELNVAEMEILGGQGIKLINISSRAIKNKLSAPESLISILSGKEVLHVESCTSSKSLLWSRISQERIERINYQECKFSGVVELHAKDINVELVRASISWWLQQVKIKEGALSYTSLRPLYTKEAMALEGPGPLLVGLVSLGTTMLTAGTCSAWAANLGLQVGSRMHLVAQAGFSSLCAQAAGSIVSNKGDPFEAIKSLASVNTVKSLATSMLSAGLLDQVSKGLNLNLTSMSKNELLAKLEYNLAKNSVGAAVNMSIYGKYEQGAIGGVVDALLGTALSPMLQKVADVTTITKFSESNQRLVHALLAGGVQSAITGGDLIDQMLSGIAEELVAAKCKGIVEGRVTDSAQVNLREQGSKIEEIADDAIVGGEEVKASSKELEALDLAVSTGSADECIEQDHQDKSYELIKELDLDPGLGKKLLIGAGRALVKTWQGLKQLGLAIGEKLQFVKDGATEEYTTQINEEVKASSKELIEEDFIERLFPDPESLTEYKKYLQKYLQVTSKKMKVDNQVVNLEQYKNKVAVDTLGIKALDLAVPAAYADDGSEIVGSQANEFQQRMRNNFPKIAKFFDAWHQVLEEGRYRDEGAHQFATSIPEALVALGTGNLAAAGVAADNAITALRQMVTNKQESSLITQGISTIGEKTGLYDPSKAEILSTAFNLGVMGVASLPQKSKSMLYALDLSTRTTSTSNVTSGLSNSMFAKTGAFTFKSTAGLGKATSSASILPRLTPQQALNSGLVAGIAVFGARATKETIDIIQEFKKHDEDFTMPGFKPEIVEPTVLVTPAADPISSSSWFPATINKGTIFQGPAAEVKKPIIFSGGIDYKDKEFFDSLNNLEKRNYITPGMFEKIKPQVKWTGVDTFTWNGLEGRVTVGGNVKIDYTQVHHIIPQGFKKEKVYEIIKDSGFNLENDANKMVLPTKEGAKISWIESAIHEGGHAKKYILEIERQLKAVQKKAEREGWYDSPKEKFQAKCQEAIKDAIQDIRSRLESGDLAVNKNGSNKLNDAPKPEVGK